RFDSMVRSDANIEVLADGFTWTEGPVWRGTNDEGHLLFSDIPRNTIFKWDPNYGVSVFLTPSGYTGNTYYGLEPGSNGLTLNRKGQLLACEHGDRRVSVLTTDGGKRTLVDNYQGKRLNSPNDLVVKSDGTIYFTDPPYGLPKRADDKRRELDFCGVYQLSTDGRLTLLTKELQRPNGIGLSPDERTLYVAQSDPKRAIWMAFDLSDGKGPLPPGRLILDVTDRVGDQHPGLPDGMTVDKRGNIWGSGPGGIYVFTPTGEQLGRLVTGDRTSNCTFGPDQKVLYMTVNHRLCRVRLAD
ncbi:MAG: SMP-30/gluconolactonase/LRE family protein, partial [Planctomycetota bacterium]